MDLATFSASKILSYSAINFYDKCKSSRNKKMLAGKNNIKSVQFKK